MMKHILGQSIFQLTLLLVFTFSADKWIPEYYPDEESTSVPGTSKYYSDGEHMRSGRAYMIGSTDEDYLRYNNVINRLVEVFDFSLGSWPL